MDDIRKVPDDRPYNDPNTMRRASVIAMMQNTTGEIKNPLLGLSKAQLMQDVEDFA